MTVSIPEPREDRMSRGFLKGPLGEDPQALGIGEVVMEETMATHACLEENQFEEVRMVKTIVVASVMVKVGNRNEDMDMTYSSRRARRRR